MKHLKLFESFHSSRKINPGEIVTILHDNYLKLLPEDFTKISSKIKDRYSKWNFKNDYSFISEGLPDGLIYNYGDWEYISIRFLRDEWFLVEIRNKRKISAWECDQLEGLYELLDEIYSKYPGIEL